MASLFAAGRRECVHVEAAGIQRFGHALDAAALAGCASFLTARATKTTADGFDFILHRQIGVLPLRGMISLSYSATL